MKSKQELEDDFHWWITCIPDKINALKKRMPAEIANKLDFSTQSLDLLEKYLLDNIGMEAIQNDWELLDGSASYLGRVYKKAIPEAEWHIELDDKKNIYYNKPALRVVNRVLFAPHSNITAALDRKTGSYLTTIIKNHIKYLEENKNSV